MNYYSNRGGNFLSNLPQVTRFLLIVNVVVFIANYLLHNILNDYGSLGAIHPGTARHASGELFVKQFEAFQVVTHMFLHGSLGHIFMNMFGLYMFGRILEQSINSKRFFILYFVSGLGAAAIQLGVYFLRAEPAMMVGASGAIFGVVTAFAVLYPNVELMIIPIPVPVKAKYLIPGFMVLSIVLGLSNIKGDFVAHFAHLGGALFGFILIKFWKRNQFRQF